MTPVMTYAALPWITRRMEWWLQGRLALAARVTGTVYGCSARSTAGSTRPSS